MSDDALVAAFHRYQATLRALVDDKRFANAYAEVNTRRIDFKGLEENVRAYAKEHLNASNGNVLIRAIKRHLPTSVQFKRNVGNALLWTKTQLHGRPYCHLLGSIQSHGRAKSSLWLAHLVKQIVGPPAFYMTEDMLRLFPRRVLKTMFRSLGVSTIVYFDDGIYSGNQAEDDIGYFDLEIGSKNFAYIVAAAYATKEALKKLKGLENNRGKRLNIQAFAPGVFVNIESSLPDTTFDRVWSTSKLRGHTLSAMPYKIPDHVSFGFGQHKQQLVHQSRVKIPYKNFSLDAYQLPTRYFTSGGTFYEGRVSRNNRDAMILDAYDRKTGLRRQEERDSIIHLIQRKLDGAALKPVSRGGNDRKGKQALIEQKYVHTLIRKLAELEAFKRNSFVNKLSALVMERLEKINSATITYADLSYPVNIKTFEWAPDVKNSLAKRRSLPYPKVGSNSTMQQAASNRQRHGEII
jgi:hypothetical protein